VIERYTRPEMGELFTDQHKFDAWLAVELAVCEAWASAGAIPRQAVDRIKRKAKFSIARINEIESQVQHDVIAFTTAVGEHLGADSAFLHKGLTSSDVVDTAQSMILKEAGQLLEKGLLALKEVVGRRALEHKRTPVIGRTHGVHAEPTTFGLKLLVWYDELARHEERLAAAIDTVAVGKLSGAVGNFAHIPPAFEEAVLKKLGLRPAPVSNQVVQRDRHAQFVCTLAMLGATLEKIALNLRTYQRTEIDEVQEPFLPGQKGSSAMPHKKNPILLERVTGLARVLRGYALTALENVALWDERDISHSGAERVILPDACILTDYMLAKLAGVVEKLEIHSERMERGIYFTKGLIFSQRVLLALADAGMTREAAYEVVQRNAMRCWQDNAPLLDALLADREARAVLSPAQISALFSLEPYFAHVDEIFARAGLVEAGAGEAAAPKAAATRGRGRASAARGPAAPRTRRAAAPAAPADQGAVQNVSERPSEWYETATLAERPRRGALSPADETLGEAEHQRAMRKARGARRSTSTPAGSRTGRGRSRAAAGPPAEKAPPAVAADPPADGAKPASRRRKPAKKDVPPVADAAPVEKPDNGAPENGAATAGEPPKKRRRGSRGGRRHRKTVPGAPTPVNGPADGDDTYIDE